jgi:large subunit ribosomal protein L18
MVDDDQGKTLCAVSTEQKDFKESGKTANMEGAELLGRRIGEKAVENGVKKALFDRGGFKYHGRVKAIADAARKAGLEF